MLNCTCYITTAAQERCFPQYNRLASMTDYLESHWPNHMGIPTGHGQQYYHQIFLGTR
jgi:hypothetical protein